MSLFALIVLNAGLAASPEEARPPYQPVAYAPQMADAKDDGVILIDASKSQRLRPAETKRRGYVSRGRLARDKTTDQGFRLEARTGWDRITLGEVGDDDRSDGLLYGLGWGYDRRFGRAFLGLFAGIDGTTAETSGEVSTSPDPLTGTIATTSFHTAAREDLEVGVRAGWWAGDEWNVYALAAWTRLSVDFEAETVAVTPVIGGPLLVSEPLIQHIETTADGWRIGAGTEANLTDNLYAKAEYRHSFYDEDEAGEDTERFQVLTGVGLRF